MDHKRSSLKNSVKAAQIAFELDQRIALHIRECAARNSLIPSDQIRKMLGLPYSPPKRPRLSLNLDENDYIKLAEKYQLDKNDHIEIKKCIMNELAKATETAIHAKSSQENGSK